MGLLDRLGQAIRAQVNGMIREAEDPEKVLEQLVAEMEQELIQMRTSLAEAIATYKRTERHVAQYEKAASDWHRRAQMALDKENETLAREALLKWKNYQIQAQPLQNQLQYQRELIDRLKQELLNLEHKHLEARTKKSLYIARLRSAIAAQKMQELVGDFHSGTILNVFERLESQILEIEAQNELTTPMNDPLERRFQSLEKDPMIESELGNLKALQGKQNSLDPELEKLRAELDEI